MKFGLIVLCRLWSTRLKEKALIKFGEMTCIERCQFNCIQSQIPDVYILATSTNSEDQKLKDYLVPGFEFFTGSEENIVDRLSECAKQFSLSHVIRVTGDSPLISYELIDLLTQSHVAKNADYSHWVGGSLGTVCDVISIDALKKLSEWIDLSKNTEYLSLFFKNNPHIFNINTQICPEQFYSNYRLNLDYPEDKLVLDSIFSKCPDTPSKLDKILMLIRRNPEISAINKEITPKYTHGDLLEELKQQTTIKNIKIKVDAPTYFIDYDWNGFDKVEDRDVEVLVTDPGSSFMYDKNVFDKMPKLQLIGTPSTGVTHIDINYCKEIGIKVLNLFEDRESLNDIHASAEFTWMLILNTIRNFVESQNCVKNKQWRDLENVLRGNELHSKNIGIVGLGRIGAKVAKFAQRFGMNVVYYDPFIKDKKYDRVNSLLDIAEFSDVISLNPYLTEQTTGMINKDFLNKCKDNVIIVNTSRGEVVNEEDICDFVEAKKIRYSSDVVAEEQNMKRFFDSRLYQLFLENKIIITPHIAGATYESQIKAFKSIMSIIKNARK